MTPVNFTAAGMGNGEEINTQTCNWKYPDIRGLQQKIHSAEFVISISSVPKARRSKGNANKGRWVPDTLRALRTVARVLQVP